jgi:hypothetical protein
MMKKNILALAALALLAWGCSSDDGGSPTPTTQKPDETIVIEPGTDARPNWVAPGDNNYEQTMNVYLTLQDQLLPYISENDMICAKIDGEVRGVAVPRQDEGDWLISLIVFSNGAAPIQLSYYCDKLHRIFTTDWITFDANVTPMGTGGIYQPTFYKQ